MRLMTLRMFLTIALLIAWRIVCDAADVQVGDAYIRTSVSGQTWTVGTDAVEWVLDGSGGQFLLTRFQNKLTSPTREYIAAQSTTTPFGVKLPVSTGEYLVDTIWSKYLPWGATADPANDSLSLVVESGDKVGFAVGPHGDYAGDETKWLTTVRYTDGQTFHSTDDPSLNQGPVWSYVLIAPGQGDLVAIDTVEYSEYSQENVRIPSQASGYRAPGDVPHIGVTRMHPSNPYDAVRVWTAPKAGTVSISGLASHPGGGDVDVKVFRIRKNPGVTPTADNQWTVSSANAHPVTTGGRPAVQLDLELTRQSLHAHYHLLAYPRTAILRQWVELENTGTGLVSLAAAVPVALRLRSDDATSFKNHWMIGGNSLENEGLMHSDPVTAAYHKQIEGNKTDDFTPWLSLQRTGGAGDGWFMMQDYLGRWRLNVEHAGTETSWVFASLPESVNRVLAAGEKLALPLVTVGTYQGSLDDMGKRVYNWQYEYLWDYTNEDWYGLMQFTAPWYNDVRNLQENFAGRLGDLDMVVSDTMRTVGMEVLWDDAGWSENPNIWTPSREGPDFAQTLRFLPKMGMKWALWFVGHPTAGLMDTKVGSWGNFQWRTDGQGNFDFALDRSWREKITRFLTIHPRSSFHTCDGGSRYAHQFEVQRLADISMFSDPGGGDQTNYYFSYFETPDKWMDLMPSWYTKGKYLPQTSRQILTMTPTWNQKATGSDVEPLRKICDLYHYLLSRGVAGRWTYLFHPGVEGDKAHYYAQRTSYDHKKALIILKHQATGTVKIYPRELLAGDNYIVGFDSTQATSTRSGADLMTKGITITNQAAGELIYLNLPDRPGSGSDHQAPQAPGRILTRRETNIGHSGVGIYWSPGADNTWISYYEVRRGATSLGKASVGTYFFDHAAGWDPKAQYSVRTIDADGNASPWTLSAPLADEPREAAALGGHFSQVGREGWRAETSTDGLTFTPMTRFVPPINNPAGDSGGTANQVGGAEGYWESANTARLGRGWQQASTSAQCVRAWVAPQAGTVRVLGRVIKEYYRTAEGGTLQVRILQNQTQVWPALGWGEVKPGDLTGLSHDLQLKVAQGDAIRFVLDRGASPDNDVVTWMPRIVYDEPEPVGPAGGVVRIRCGAGEPTTDALGNVWSVDRFFSGGEPMSVTGEKIKDAQPTPADQALYQGGRQGNDFSYAIPVPPGLYAVRLKFAEPQYEYFSERPMSLSINGRPVMTNVDIGQAARGWRQAYERDFRYLVPNAEGKLVLRFRGGFAPLAKTDQAMVQAIEVLPEIRPDASDARTAIPEGLWRRFAGAVATPFHKTAIAAARCDVLVCQAEKSGRGEVNDAEVNEALVVPVAAERKTVSAAAVARDLQPEHRAVVRIDAGATDEHIDWNGFVWNGDYGCGTGHVLSSSAPVSQAAPTLHDQHLYQTARAASVLVYTFTLPPGLYTVHLKFAELWLAQAGRRPMNITVNGRRIAENWDPASAAGQTGMAADLRAEDVTPDKANQITIKLEATGANEAIVQGIEIE